MSSKLNYFPFDFINHIHLKQNSILQWKDIIIVQKIYWAVAVCKKPTVQRKTPLFTQFLVKQMVVVDFCQCFTRLRTSQLKVKAILYTMALENFIHFERKKKKNVGKKKTYKLKLSFSTTVHFKEKVCFFTWHCTLSFSRAGYI